MNHNNYGFHSVLLASFELNKQTFDYKARYFWDASTSSSLHLHSIMQFNSLIFQLCNINANSYGYIDIALSVLCILSSVTAAWDASNIQCPLEEGYWSHCFVCTCVWLKGTSQVIQKRLKFKGHLHITFSNAFIQPALFCSMLCFAVEILPVSLKKQTFFLSWGNMNTAWYRVENPNFFFQML